MATVQVELRCRVNDDGTYDGFIVGGPEMGEVKGGDCEEIKDLWRRAFKNYGVRPVVSGECGDCLTPEFTENEPAPPIR